MVFKLKGDYPEAIKWFNRLFVLACSIGFKKGESSALGNLGMVHSILGNYDEALRLYSETIAINKEQCNNDGLVPNYINIGAIHTHLKNYDRALYYYQKALSSIDDDSKSFHIATHRTFALKRIASTCLSQNITEGVLEIVNESIKVGKDIDDTLGLASSYEILGKYYESLKEYKTSLKSYNKSLNLYETLGFNQGIADLLLHRGRINLILGDPQKALEYLHKGIEIAKNIASKATETRGYEYLSEFYEAKADYKKCFKYYKIYRELHDETLVKEIADNIARVELIHDIKKNEEESEIVRLKNIELQQEIEERKRVEVALMKSEEKYRLLSIEDPLTGIFNRRYLFETGGNIVSRSLLSKSDVCLGMLDIDHFKAINDKFGHQTGDHILREFAKVVSECLRPNDFFARYGGEEFAILFVDCGINEAVTIMNRINKVIDNKNFAFNNLEIAVTVSGGISHSSEVTSINTLSELIKLADSRMYKAKELGRNRIHCLDA